MKKLFAALLAFTMILSSAVLCVSAEEATSWADNASTTWYTDAIAANENATTFTISTAADLAGLAKLVDGGNTFAGKTVNVNATTIDLSAHYWEPIGAEEAPFQGTFDGNGVTITGMKIDSAEEGAQAFFAIVSSTTEENVAKIQNFSLVNSSVKTSVTLYSALVIGKISTSNIGTVDVENVYAQGTVTSSVSDVSVIGGICAYAHVNLGSIAFENVVSNVAVQNTVESMGYAGGMVGHLQCVGGSYPLYLTNVVNQGAISGKQLYSGGLIGFNDVNAWCVVTLDYCLNVGSASASENGAAGAFVGFHNRNNQEMHFKNSAYDSTLNIIGKVQDNVTKFRYRPNNCYVINATEVETGYTAISADQINVFSNILTTASTLTGYANVEKTMEGLVAACNAVAKTSGLCAMQISTGNTNDKYSVRFIAKLDSDDYVRAGIKVSINGVEKIMDTTTVYEEISAYTENGTIASYKATQLGATYLYAVGVYNIPTGAENVVITVTPYTVAMDGENEQTVDGDAYEITFNKGVYVGAEKVEQAA
ncbi:MAG: hypothetical protein J6B71_09520 [Clostridia bacterium]|nr:hypothetical protein [Clostridia bacterium]